MRKTISLILALVMCLALCACGPSQEEIDASVAEQESAARIDKAQAAINTLHEMTDWKNWTDSYDYGDFLDDFGDTLYLTETAEIHHNDWTLAYIAAQEAYDALSDEEKQQIQNPEWITEDEYLVSRYEEILIQQEIVLACKEAAVEKLKNSLINKSSYEEYGWEMKHCFYYESTGTFDVEIRIEYSATNRVGGRIDDVEYADCDGTYSNGVVTITKID